ncbi:glycerol dehydratase, cobalamin-independent, large subunit [Syntrophus gentianae]|uniref:Glycerol dehydratase, cobalamin-independent, large subunit n=1 Tax=Syntrophus gentianae TaxID=43775 RepID=A0A1H7ZPG5_9BACT|nr:pyruvate formate lyase family protein [Syntrophus gentianae]SEM59754.1 glycerol dehydratase, cobalamin-independent, large subunit [Syntrophus gentianae]
MGTVTLKDIRIADMNLETLPLLSSLKEQCLSAKAEVCIERAKHITTFLRDRADESEPMEMRYARAVNYFLANKRSLFSDDSLLAGTTTAKAFGAPVYPELTGIYIWPELDTMTNREKNPQILSRTDADELNFNIFPYWMERNILEATRAREGNPPCMKLFERTVFFIASKAGTISHTVPCYRVALEKGLEAIIAEAAQKEQRLAGKGSLSPDEAQQRDFYRAVQIALSGIITYAANLSARAAELARQETDPVRRKNLEAMASVCAQVPAKPARTFREAVNGLWILQIGIHAENINMAMSPGRLDQILYPWYSRDMADGKLTLKEAMELVGCLWLKLNDNTNLVPETSEELFGGAGTVPAVTVGGIDEEGEDAVNDLTYIMLRITELLKTRDPSLNARYYMGKNSVAYRDRVAEVIANTRAVPAFYNDIAAIRTLENQGIATKDARDYAIIGCVELSASGRSYDASSSIMLNLVSALELALYNGTRPVTEEEQIGPATGVAESFQTFEAFWEAFKTQLGCLIGEAVQLNEMMGKTHQEILPTPLLSALFEGPMEKGTDLIFGGARYNSSGATHIGFADTVDSLNAIEKGVFIDRRVTFPELIAALKRDFEGDAALHAYLVNRVPKYGSEDPIAVKNSHNLLRFLYETYQGYTNYRGGKYRPAYWTMTNHAGQGKLSGALPNGRRAYRIFASGITPVSQAAGELAACLNAVGDINVLHIPGGEAFNLKYSAIQGEEDLQKFSAAIEAYFRSGGLHIQFNIMSYEMLLDAKAHPDNYPELLVRVSGYSAYFKDLNEAMKDEIITRTAYDLKTGKAAHFPEEHKGMLPST